MRRTGPRKARRAPLRARRDGEKAWRQGDSRKTRQTAQCAFARHLPKKRQADPHRGGKNELRGRQKHDKRRKGRHFPNVVPRRGGWRKCESEKAKMQRKTHRCAVARKQGLAVTGGESARHAPIVPHPDPKNQYFTLKSI